MGESHFRHGLRPQSTASRHSRSVTVNEDQSRSKFKNVWESPSRKVRPATTPSHSTLPGSLLSASAGRGRSNGVGGLQASGLRVRGHASVKERDDGILRRSVAVARRATNQRQRHPERHRRAARRRLPPHFQTKQHDGTRVTLPEPDSSTHLASTSRLASRANHQHYAK
ncbi:hypothetical protein DENSPDRAFT_496213 [Dentipellis sp. KUC8613]|nr:hypothetical protein DENSPDRAFT_496213 [Dentipellis sp. KUC8613]